MSVRAAWCGPGCGEALEIGDAEGLTSCFGIDSGGAQVLFSLLVAAGPSGQCRTESLATSMWTRPESMFGAGQNTFLPMRPARVTSPYHWALTLGTP